MSNQKRPFITQKDIDELTKHGVDFEKDMKVFLKELKAFLIVTWAKEFHKDIDKLETHGLEILNKSIDYPSTGAYHILEDTFCACDETIGILSNDSRRLFNYFYPDIHLRLDEE